MVRPIIWMSLICIMLLPLKIRAQECTLTLVGDVMLGRHIDEIHKGNYSTLWGDTLPLLKSGDLTLINHEFVLTSHKTPEEKTFNFRANPSRVKSLTAAGIDYVSLANNHSLDYGPEGLSDTLKILSDNQIAYAGAGANSEAASKPALLNCGPYKIGILSLTNNMPEWAATDKKPGVLYSPINKTAISKIKTLVNKLKPEVDFVILSTHWGRNWDEMPPEDFRDFAHALMDAGVDIWHGHSGHIIQGIELYKGKPIFYCLGDLIDDYQVEKARNDLAYITTIKIKDKEISEIKIIPTAIKNFRASVAKGDDLERVITKLNQNSKPYSTPILRQENVLLIHPQKIN